MFGEKNSTYGLNDWKAIFIIGAYEMFTLLSLYIYWGLIKGEMYFPNNPLLLIFITALILGIKHYFFFYKKEKWKKYVRVFNRLYKKEIKHYNIIYQIVSSILILNILLMYVLLYNLW
jgi:hypothetical protein